MVMAKPIEPTPVLEGKDTLRLINEVNSASYSEKKAKFLEECTETYKKTKK
jgi:hypothetical protein